MKTVYICGDSFAVPDQEYGECWVDLLSAHVDIVNLSKVCASNLMISKQVDYAISKKPDYIICLGTSSTRQDIMYNGELISYSIHSINDTTKFNQTEKDVLKTHAVKFFNLDISVYLNQCVIENTLQKLVDSSVPFIFDRGGFEHRSFVGSKQTEYFVKYQLYISDINLWDYAKSRAFRPYYHITDTEAHQHIAKYFLDKINT